MSSTSRTLRPLYEVIVLLDVRIGSGNTAGPALAEVRPGASSVKAAAASDATTQRHLKPRITKSLATNDTMHVGGS
jgi:hypothetical protein